MGIGIIGIGSGGKDFESFGGILNGSLSKILTISGVGTFVDMDMVTAIDPNSTSDWIQSADGKLQYTGTETFIALLDFNTSLELVSAGTNGLRLNIRRNSVDIQGLGECEITATQAYPNMTFIVSVIPNVVFDAQTANNSSTINFRQRTIYMRVTKI